MRNKKFVWAIVIVLIISTLFMLTACNGKSVAPASIELSRGSLTLVVGESQTLSVLATPANAKIDGVSWTSSDSQVASVSDGKVSALKVGNAIIRANLGSLKADCRVTVTGGSGEGDMVTSVVLNAATVELRLGVNPTYQLEATVLPSTAADKSLTYSSDDTSIATVSQEGLITAVASGICTISCTSSNNITSRCRVTVYKADGTLDQGLYVAKVEGLQNRSEDFHMVMDASAVPSLEAAGVRYKDFDGQYKDVFGILKDNGITDIRIRVWNDPKNENGEWYGGGNCDLNNAVTIARRCEAVGLGVIIDFHYSDFWADPGKQTLPKAWATLSVSDIEQKVYQFTFDSLNDIAATGADITMVQIGNETNQFFLGSKDWPTITRYFKAGIRAVREATGEVDEGGAKTIIHFANPENADYVGKADELYKNGVDYDVFGSSYYPYWHGTLDNLKAQLKGVHDKYPDKEVMVMETSYAFTNEDADGYGNTSSTPVNYPLTVQGQSNQVRDVIDAMASLGDYAIGVAYWEGTWIAATTSGVAAENVAKCKEFGCGWSSYAAHDYDPDADDGACVIDNQAFFLSDGTPLESLKVFKLVKEGHNVTLTADYIERQDIYYTVGVGPIVLPETATVSFNSGGQPQAVDVTWNCTAEDLARYINEVGNYKVTGTTEYGGEAILYIWVMNENIFTNASFEESRGNAQTDNLIQGPGGDWKMDPDYTVGGGKLQLYVSNEAQNARMGVNSFHFWDEGTVKFTLSQTFEAADLLKYGSGKYGASFDIQGNDGANVDVHAYIKIKTKSGDVRTVSGDKVGLDGWTIWNRAAISGVEIDLDEIESVEVGIYVYAELAGKGPWGNIDNCQFYFEEA